MAYFICEKQGRCCPHEFYDSIEQAITDSEDGVPCEHLIEVAPVQHGRWGTHSDRPDSLICSVCKCGFDMWKHDPHNFCPNCGAKMDGGDEDG